MKRFGLPSLALPTRSSQSETPLPPPASRLILPHQVFPTEDEHIRGISKRLTSGYAETTGVRKNMEDRMIIFGSLRSKEDEDYFAVFDGHNGDSAAKYCAGRMHVKLAEILEAADSAGMEFDAVTCFRSAFKVTNEGLKKVRAAGGTTAVVALFKGAELYIANTGDSRAVLSKNRCAVRVTTDHKPDLPEEKSRIEKHGGWVQNGGITGTLTVSRALGDFSYLPFITCEPDVFGPFPVNSDIYELLILACDGLWDVVSDEEAVEIALTAKNPEEAAVKLRDKASNSKSLDNISVLVVFFQSYVCQEDCLEKNQKPEKSEIVRKNEKTEKNEKSESVVSSTQKKSSERNRRRIPKTTNNGNLSDSSPTKKSETKHMWALTPKHCLIIFLLLLFFYFFFSMKQSDSLNKTI